MTRQLSLPVQSEAAQEFNRPVETLELQLDTGTVRFVATNDYVFFASNTYAPLPFERSSIRTGLDLSVDEVELSVGNVDLFFSQSVIATDWVRKTLTIKKIFLDKLDDSSAFLVLFKGKTDEPVIDENKFTIKVRSILDSMHHTLPRRIFSTLCNYQHYDPSCTVSRIVDTNLVTGTALGSGSLTLTLASSVFTVNADNYWGPIGTVTMKTGSNNSLGREVMQHSQSSGSVTVRVPFPFTINSGDVFEITRGCIKTTGECRTKYDNYLNYGGYPVTPKHPIVAGPGGGGFAGGGGKFPIGK